MKNSTLPILLAVLAALFSTLACLLFGSGAPTVEQPAATDLPTTRASAMPSPTLSSLQAPETDDGDEPVLITGEIRYTSPFFLNTIPASMVLLEDQAGFVRRDRQFKFSRIGQVIGPVQVLDDERLSFSLTLPSVPNGVLVDVDNDGDKDLGVQVFAVAYWSNTWGDPFLEERDAHGWSTAYATTIVDPENDDEIIGGTLIVWVPDADQQFPVDFGQDGLLFSEDDPVAPIPPGYNLVDLDQSPFNVYKEARPFFQLNEGEVALNDFSELSYEESFAAMFEKVSAEYPFTAEKGIDWEALQDEYGARAAGVTNDEDFYRVLRDMALEIPDGHVNVSLNSNVFFEESAGSFGLVLSELSDGKIIATQVLSGTPGEEAGILPGAEITEWDGAPVGEAISAVIPRLGPYSTDHTNRIAQVNFLTRVPPGSRVECTFINPGESEPESVSMIAEVEYDSLLQTFPTSNLDMLELPIEGELFEEEGLAYIRVLSFLGDYQLFARLWDHNLELLIDEEVKGLIIDLRTNGGGRSDLPIQFAGYFFDETVPLYQSYYYSHDSQEFELSGEPQKIEPAPMHFEGPIAVLVSPDCVSACESFAYALSTGGRSIVVGHYPTAGAFGEVSRGQYSLPGDYSIQFPTGRSQTLDGKLVIEGVGVVPQVVVPVTLASAMGEEDAVLEAAIEALEELIN